MWVPNRKAAIPDMTIFETIDRAIGIMGSPSSLAGWTSNPKAHTYAALILGLRPLISVEVGVWCGRGAISMALAHKEVGRGKAYAVDAWSAAASVEGQLHPADQKHWSNQAEHNAAKAMFLAKINELELGNCIEVVHSRSLDFTPPKNIGLISIDGNHGEVVISDVAHYAPCVRPGGIVHIDDLDWTGGAVRKASENLKRMGFQELYTFETGAFFQRI